jgi:TonB family protein
MPEATPISATGNRSSERRILPRQTLESLSYVDLGDTNGGIILNVSEGGLAFRAAIPVMDDRIPKLRFQLAADELPVEAEGRVAWTADENRMVGVTFVQLEATARERIKNWITLAANPSEIPPSTAAAPARRELAPLTLEKVDAPEKLISLETKVLAPTFPDVPELPKPSAISRPASVPAPAPVIATVPGNSGPSLERISIDSLLPRSTQEKLRPSIGSLIAARSTAQRERRPRKSPSPHATGIPNLQVRAPVVILLAVALVLLIWMIGRGGALLPAFSDAASTQGAQNSSSPGASGRLREIAIVDASGRIRTIPWEVQQASLGVSAAMQSQRHTVSPAPAKNADSVADPPATSEGASSSTDASHSVTRMWSLPQPGKSTASPASSAQQQAQLPSLKQNSPVVPGAFPSALSASRIEPPVDPENALAASQPTSPLLRSNSGPHAGVLIRRVEPIYPPKAAAEKIEGIVAMQVVVGKDGRVHTIKVLSGPKALEDAAVDAVKLWRYEPALVDGKVAESRQYIQLTFRLGSH